MNENPAATGADVRTRLVRAAERLLAASADGQISTREICAGAQVTAPTLYHHFADKHALLDAVVLEGFTRYLEGKRALSPSGDALEEFRTGWDMHVSFGCEHPAHYRLMFGNPQPGLIAPAALVARDEVARTVSRWGAEGGLRVPVDAAIETMSAAAVGVTLQLITMPADSRHPLSTNVRDTVARAIFRQPAESERSAHPIAEPARQLLEALPTDAPQPLRPTELALLREWLAALADAATREGETHDR